MNYVYAGRVIYTSDYRQITDTQTFSNDESAWKWCDEQVQKHEEKSYKTDLVRIEGVTKIRVHD